MIDKINKYPKLWMAVKFIKLVRDCILINISVPLLLSFFSIEFKHLPFFVGGYFVYKMIAIYFEWKNFSFSFEQDYLKVSSGVFINKSVLIPLKQIQSINTYTDLLHRILGLTILLIDTGTSENNSNLKLDLLSREHAKEIKEFIDSNLGRFEEENAKPSNQLESAKFFYELTKYEYIVGAVSPLKTILFMGFIYSVYVKINVVFPIEVKIDQLIDFFFGNMYVSILSVVIFFILSILYSVLKSYNKYGNHQVRATEQMIYINNGILNNNEFIIPINKIQALTLHDSLLQKITGLKKVKIISLNDEENEKVVIPNVIFPYVLKEYSEKFISYVLPDFHVKGDYKKIPKSSLFVKIIRSFLHATIINCLAYLLLSSLFNIIFPLTLVYIFIQMLSAFFNEYFISEQLLSFKKIGVYNKVFITPLKNIEEVSISQGLLQKIFSLSTIKIVNKSTPYKKSVFKDLPYSESCRFLINFKKINDTEEDKKHYVGNCIQRV